MKKKSLQRKAKSVAGLAIATLGTMATLTNAEESGGAYDTPKEDFSVSALKNGYKLADAKRLHDAWNLGKFLDITESGAFSYFQLHEFMPHALIRRDGPVLEMEQALDASIGKLSLKNHDGKDVVFEEMITAEDSPVQGVMVVKNGKVLYEVYPGMRKTDRHVWMSNAKVFAGLLIAMLEDEGKIDLSKSVADYVKEAKGTAWEAVTVKDVLNMESGLDLEENPATRKGDTPYARFVSTEVGATKKEDGSLLTHDEALLSIPKLKEPGTAFEYSSANTQMLGLIIEAVEDKRLGEIITERIWSKSKMTGDATLGLSPQGNGIIHGLISTRLDDMAKFGMLFTPSAKLVSDEQIVSPAVLKRMQTGGTKENFMKGTLGPRMAEEFRDQPIFNAYQWDAVFADGDLYKSGMNGQGLYASPSRDAVVVWFATGFPEIPMEAFSRAIIKTLK